MRPWLVVYAVDREIDLARITAERGDDLAHGRLTCLRTGVGKVRSATEVNTYLTSALRAHQPRPKILNVGTCASLVEGLGGKLVSASYALDRDSTPEMLLAAGVEPQPVIPLESFNNSGLTIGTGDGFVANDIEAENLRRRGVSLVDMETHAVAWTALKYLAGKIISLRFVTDTGGDNATKEWIDMLEEARKSLTNAVLELTARPAKP